MNAKGLLAMRKSITTRLCLIFAMAISALCAGVEDHASIGKKDDPTLLYDSCTDDWREHWTLDGQKATLTHSDKGMDFWAGPTFREDASHAVLWTKQSFSGDIKIEYEYTRLDRATRCATILYVQATGSGEDPYVTDIAQWSDRRIVPAMRRYFDHMNTYHISYAAFNNNNDDPSEDYVRARRYMPLRMKGLRGTDLKPDFARTGLFSTDMPHRITVIKRGNTLSMRVQNDEAEKTFLWTNDTLPGIVEGRIGLRHMFTRGARYRDFRVTQLGAREGNSNP